MEHVYITICRENKKWYIGSHNGKNKKYIGSGLLLKNAIRKYGKDKFDKIIIYEGKEYREVEEFLLKAADAANDRNSYNMKNEALGGVFIGEANGMYGKKHTEENRYRCGNSFRGKKRPKHSEKMSGPGNPMYGKKHTQETKKKISDKNKNRTWSQEAKKAQSLRLKGKKHNLKTVVCPHCSKEGKGPNMTRYHFDSCKEKK